MKRRKLLRYLESHGCVLLREGGGHTIYTNPPKKLQSPVPRHPDIQPVIVRKICKQLDIPTPREK
jgi:predicted RNA binding protein YcfA (HicA-like mRNA interferase family)